MRKDVLAGAAAVGAALIGGAFYVFKERQTEEPDYRVLVTEGDYQLRDYPEMTVAETVSRADARRRSARASGSWPIIFLPNREAARNCR